MPITILSDDALTYVIQIVGWPAAYRLGRVSRQFLRACQRCPNWVAAERSRLRSHGAHLRGFSLHLRMAISIVTDKTPNPPQFVPWEERPRDKRFQKLSETHFEESFESELDVELPLWWWNEKFLIDNTRTSWNIPRPPGLPPPILGAMAYKLQLLNVTLVQRRDFAGRERRREFKVRTGYLGTGNTGFVFSKVPVMLMDFVQLELQAGEGPPADDPSVLDPRRRDFRCYPRLAERAGYAVDDWDLELNREDRPCGRVLDEELLKDIQMSFLAGRDFRSRHGWVHTPHHSADLREFAEEVQYDLRIGSSYDFREGTFILDLLLEDGSGYDILDDMDYPREGVAYIWGLLGHAPSATALDPFNRRRQASRLSAWLRSANAS